MRAEITKTVVGKHSRGRTMGLKENLAVEQVRNLSIRTPVIADADSTVRDAVLKMREAQLGCIFVVDDNHKPQGIFTEAMLRLLLAKSPQSVNDPLEKHLAKSFAWVKLSDPIETVMDAMETKNIRFVAVVDDEGKLTGLTGQKGLMEYVAEHFPGEVMVQRVGSNPYPASREGA
ncbi:MAG: hypothetical protein Tsb009_01450 [Planctomycetaceae bacterium]